MWVVEHLGVGGAPLRLEITVELINELRMLAEDLYVNGYNRYSAAMSKAADELAKWESVFGHLGDTPDECGNAIIAARDELEERCAELADALRSTAQTLAWMQHGKCRGFSDDLLTTNEALEKARAALEGLK